MASPYPRIAILGRLGTPQLACLRSWKRLGVQAVFLHAAPTPLPRGLQTLLGLRCVHLGPLRLDDPAFVARLADVLVDEGVQALTCVSESISIDLWGCRDALPPWLQIVSVRPEQVRVLQSKVEQDRLARSVGLDCLPTQHFAPAAWLHLPQDAFPLVLRPDVASEALPPFKVEVVHNTVQLQRLLQRLHPKSTGVVAQPLVHGPNLLVHGWRSADGKQSGQVAFRVSVKHRGLTVVMQPAEPDPQLLQGCARMAERLGLTGVFHFEFIEDPASGRTCFLDLNPRLGGTTGKALSAGYDEPLALLSTLVQGGLPRAAFLSPRLAGAGAKHQALRALLSALRGTSTAADYPYPARGRTVRALLRYLLLGRDEVLRLGAWRSTLAFALYQLLRRVA
jgi:hypothetical protein